MKKLSQPKFVSHEGKVHIQQLLDHFEHIGSNGTHQILVLEPMGRNLADWLQLQDQFEKQTAGGRLGHAREVARQIVLGLDYIHSQGIVHRGW